MIKEINYKLDGCWFLIIFRDVGREDGGRQWDGHINLSKFRTVCWSEKGEGREGARQRPISWT
jgi:hypothetical protein